MILEARHDAKRSKEDKEASLLHVQVCILAWKCWCTRVVDVVEFCSNLNFIYPEEKRDQRHGTMKTIWVPFGSNDSGFVE